MLSLLHGGTAFHLGASSILAVGMGRLGSLAGDARSIAGQSNSLRNNKNSVLGVLQLSATTRREVLAKSSLMASLLLASPAGATDWKKAVEIFGSDGDLQPDMQQQFLSKIGKSLDKNFIDKRRPPPVRLPRTLVYRPFAVLLMRSCYDAVDELNFVPMDQFQKDFFLLRQNEWEKYLEENDCKQGELSDPKYFDFISAAQFATITQKMGEAKLVFEERTGAEGTVSLVSRDAGLKDNEALPAALFRAAGDKMYAGLMANFTGENFYTQPPPPLALDASDDEVIGGLEQLYKKMVELGYALDVTVTQDTMPASAFLAERGLASTFASTFAASLALPPISASLPPQGRTVTFKLKAPPTLWGRQWLGMQDYLHNDHDVMLAQAFLRTGRRAATVHTKVDSNSFSRQFVLL